MSSYEVSENFKQEWAFQAVFWTIIIELECKLYSSGSMFPSK
jgi:hypothetical protein